MRVEHRRYTSKNYYVLKLNKNWKDESQVNNKEKKLKLKGAAIPLAFTSDVKYGIAPTAKSTSNIRI